MQIIEIKDKDQWNTLVAGRKHAQFLQSWEWGEFHRKMGRKVWRIGVDTKQRECEPVFADSYDLSRRAKADKAKHELTRKKVPDGSLLNSMAAQIIKYDLPFGQSYLYCPRGGAVEIFFKKIKKLAREEKSMFVRFEPSCDANDLKMGRRVKSVQPENEWMLDVGKDKEELLAGMHSKTRYNIMLAKKKNVKVRVANDNKDFEKFWELISNTYNRKQLRTHTKEYYRGILGIGETPINANVNTNQREWGGGGDGGKFQKEGNQNADVKLWVAEYGGKIIAANMVSYFGDTVTYMHGGADYESRSLMATYLLQWETIQDAMKKKYKYYNFGGVETEKGKWQGITRFKKGFGGFEVNYGGTYEVVLRKIWYNMYKLVKGLKF